MNKNDELIEVTAPNENEFPYGAKVTIFLNGMVQFESDIKDKLISLDDKLVIGFRQNEHTNTHFQEITVPGYQEWNVSILGFQTACEAEKAGLKLAESLFWLSISRNFPIRFIYYKSLPCTVFDRTLGGISSSVSGYGYHQQTENKNDIVSCIKEVFTSEIEPKIDRERLLLAMELYSSSNLEITQQSKFITLITSLEALSEQKDYTKFISFVEDKFIALKNAIESQHEANNPKEIKSSLITSLEALFKQDDFIKYISLVEDKITELKKSIESVDKANIPEKVKNSLKDRIGKDLLRES